MLVSLGSLLILNCTHTHTCSHRRVDQYIYVYIYIYIDSLSRAWLLFHISVPNSCHGLSYKKTLIIIDYI